MANVQVNGSEAEQNGSNGSSTPHGYRAMTEDDYDVYLVARSTGVSVKQAAKKCGFSVSSIYRFQENHPEKWEAFKKAIRQNALDMIARAAQKNWQAAAWMLERCFPDEFALRVVNRTHHTGEIEQKVILIDFERLKEMHKLAAEVEKEQPRFSLS